MFYSSRRILSFIGKTINQYIQMLWEVNNEVNDQNLLKLIGNGLFCKKY